MENDLFNIAPWQEWLQQHINDDVNDLALKMASRKDLPLKELLVQLKARQMASSKLPGWSKVENIVFPDVLAVEQCSGEPAALFKSAILKGDSLADLTGGLGADTLAFSRNFKKVFYNEPHAHRFRAAHHNLPLLGAGNINYSNFSAEEFLDRTTQLFDAIYVDPSRRKEGKKVFMPEDLEPDVVQLKDKLLSRCGDLLIKMAPMLDISAALLRFPETKSVYIISYRNECRELIFHLQREQVNETLLQAVELMPDNNYVFSFTRPEEKNSYPAYSEPLNYIYDPFACISKAGAFNILCDRFNLKALHVNTHVYTSDELETDFPGRIFKLKDIFQYSDFKKLKGMHANMLLRNFPQQAAKDLKKLGFISDLNQYIFFVTAEKNERLAILTERIR